MTRGLSKAPGGKGIWLAMLAALAISSGIVLALAIAAKPAEAAATSRSVEAEKMRGSGKVFRDRTASNNRAKVFYRNRGAATRVRGQIRYIAVRARGDRCGKAPRMKVMVGGKRVMVRSVKNQKRWRYYGQRVRTSGGIHRVKVIFTNDRKTRKCDRNLRADRVNLRLASRPAPEPATKPGSGSYDSVSKRADVEIEAWAQWLKENDATGYWGETSWPNEHQRTRPDLKKWEALGDFVVRELSSHSDVISRTTLWVASKNSGPSHFRLHDAGASPPSGFENRTLQRNNSQYNNVISKYMANNPSIRGINFGGGEREAGLSNDDRGTYGSNYYYPKAEDLQYLAAQGYEVVRLPIRWERIQPTLGGAIDPDERNRITAVLDAAEVNGLAVVLDVHNFGKYIEVGGASKRLGSGVSKGQFAHLWSSLANQYADHPAIQRDGGGFDIMNEPMSIGSASGQTEAESWEQFSQAAVDVIRNHSQTVTIYVPGLHKHPKAKGGGVFAFILNHPDSWINDPAGKTVYTTHGYWGMYNYGTNHPNDPLQTYEETNVWFSDHGYQFP